MATPPVASSKRAPVGPFNDDPAAPVVEVLQHWATTQLELAVTNQPWLLDVDALVVATSGTGELGTLGEALADTRPLPSLPEALLSAGRNPDDYSPARPLIAITPDPTAMSIIYATCDDPDGNAQPRLAGIAAAAAAAAAVALPAGAVAVPIIGTGAAELPVATTVAEILGELASAAHAGRLPPRVVLVAGDTTVASIVSDLVRPRQPPLARNDRAEGDDRLDVALDANALADLLLLRAATPPLAVGVIGDWGSGKSFVMHLMRRHLDAIRARPVDPRTAWAAEGRSDEYVGHVYPIHFNAWTYAKSDLWAGLMQTIFTTLDRQLTLENKLATAARVAGGGAGSGGVADSSPFEASDPWREDAGEILALFPRLEGRTPGEIEQILAGVDDPRVRASLRSPREDDGLWARLRELRKDAENTLAKKQVALAAVTAEADLEVARAVSGIVRGRAARAASTELNALLAEGGLRRDLPEPPVGAMATLDADAAAATVRALAPRSRDYSGWIVGGAAAVAVVTWTAIEAYAPGVALGAAGVVATAAGAAARGRQITHVLAAARARWLASLAEADQRIAAEQPQLVAALRSADQKLDDALRSKEEAQTEVAQLQQSLGLTAEYASLTDFVHARLVEGGYADHLGLMQRVQQDFEQLSAALAAPAGRDRAKFEGCFPRGPARVVLFIDDLDRCPPARVVAVLEAVKLLLDTRLFVVVVAVDLRYVARALEKDYKDVLRPDEPPSGLDYIEKIFQLPYRVQPAGQTALGGYLDALIGPSGPATGASNSAGGQTDRVGPARVSPDSLTGPAAVTGAITISPAEASLLQRTCAAARLTPRAVKRVVNVVQAMKLVFARRYREVSDDQFSAAVLLFALSGARPRAIRDVLATLPEAAATTPSQSIAGHIQARMRLLASVPRADAAEVEAILQRINPPSPRPDQLVVGGLTLADAVGHDDWFRLTCAFCFVGD